MKIFKENYSFSRLRFHLSAVHLFLDSHFICPYNSLKKTRSAEEIMLSRLFYWRQKHERSECTLLAANCLGRQHWYNCMESALAFFRTKVMGRGGDSLLCVCLSFCKHSRVA